MGEFFHGWRRKIGVVTLLLTCVLMAGWLRSFVVGDTVLFSEGFTTVALHSCTGRLYLIAGTDSTRFDEPTKLMQPEWHVFPPINFVMPDPPEHSGGFQFMGFVIGANKSHPGQIEYRSDVCLIPYWLIILPLTLLSAYLLLSKTRQSTPTKIAKPTANEGA